MIPVSIHGILDYMVGLLLIAAPWLFGFSDSRSAVPVTVGLGIFTLIYSLVTKYRYGLVPLLPFKVHLVIDLLSGIFLIAAPWMFGFGNTVYWPHLLIGLLEIVVVLLSRRSGDA